MYVVGSLCLDMCMLLLSMSYCQHSEGAWNKRMGQDKSGQPKGGESIKYGIQQNYVDTVWAKHTKFVPRVSQRCDLSSVFGCLIERIGSKLDNGKQSRQKIGRLAKGGFPCSNSGGRIDCHNTLKV